MAITQLVEYEDAPPEVRVFCDDRYQVPVDERFSSAPPRSRA